MELVRGLTVFQKVEVQFASSRQTLIPFFAG